MRKSKHGKDKPVFLGADTGFNSKCRKRKFKTCRVLWVFPTKAPLPSTKPTRKSLSLCSEWYSRRWTFPYARNRETAFSGLQQCGMYLTNSFTCTQTQSHDNQLHLQSHYISTTGPKHYNARALWLANLNRQDTIYKVPNLCALIFTRVQVAQGNDTAAT